MGFPVDRPRRLRRTSALRRLVAETRLHPSDLVLPLFVKEGITEAAPVDSMPGVVQHTRESLRKAAHEAVEAGVGGVMLFGIPSFKDAVGSQADADEGIVQRALRDLKSDLGDDAVVMADLCLCEYTDHGHCGPLTALGDVDNDVTIERYASVAVAQAAAGADVIAPSGMMDGQVGSDSCRRSTTMVTTIVRSWLMPRSMRRRSMVRSAMLLRVHRRMGDRRGYQMDPANADEALREVFTDLEQGADWVMVKPAGPYLDVIRRVADAVDVPVAAYQVSGEMAMVEAAAANGWIDRDRAIAESLIAIKRAGANQILTYWATEVALALR